MTRLFAWEIDVFQHLNLNPLSSFQLWLHPSTQNPDGGLSDSLFSTPFRHLRVLASFLYVTSSSPPPPHLFVHLLENGCRLYKHQVGYVIYYSLATTKGTRAYAMLQGLFMRRKCLDCCFYSVMSGVITGPHFIRFFGGPDAIQVGSMVAVLEIGAFSWVELAVTLCLLDPQLTWFSLPFFFLFL